MKNLGRLREQFDGRIAKDTDTKEDSKKIYKL
jgi:hypothetical protein